MFKFWSWAGPIRTRQNNVMLGIFLALNAGAINAGGFLLIGQYTSHMTGWLSSIADHTIQGFFSLGVSALFAVILFVLGAMTASWCVQWSSRMRLHSRYAIPLLLEAIFLMLLGLIGTKLSQESALVLPLATIVLCFLMGLQNSLVTIATSYSIRTTHITGILTDLGIEFGKLLYWNTRKRSLLSKPIRADRFRLYTNCSLLLAFVLGAFLGAYGFKHVGFTLTIPIAIAFVCITAPVVLLDIGRWIYAGSRRWWRRKKKSSA